jgi:hypothetical protein
MLKAYEGIVLIFFVGNVFFLNGKKKIGLQNSAVHFRAAAKHKMMTSKASRRNYRHLDYRL